MKIRGLDTPQSFYRFSLFFYINSMGIVSKDICVLKKFIRYQRPGSAQKNHPRDRCLSRKLVKNWEKNSGGSAPRNPPFFIYKTIFFFYTTKLSLFLLLFFPFSFSFSFFLFYFISNILKYAIFYIYHNKILISHLDKEN